MDRIRKALDKSRLNKRPSPKFDLTLNDDTVYEHPFQNIVYSQSKTIEVSQSSLAENRLIAGNNTDPRATAFGMLRTQVLHAMRENGWISVGVSGPSAEVGKSTVACNLALSIALDINQTVLLVDADLRRPSIHKYFNFDPECGLSDYLLGSVKLTELFVNPDINRLVLLPGRGTTTESSELLSSPKMAGLVSDLKSKYHSRIIVFDMPPLLDTADSIIFLPHVDSTLLVVENGKSTESEIKESMRSLESTNLIGVVLNKADEDVRNYY
jgi:capsular exopolysaccharide synthesis family protein